MSFVFPFTDFATTETHRKFWARVAPPNEAGCTEWTGNRDKDGYGRFLADGKVVRTHRYAYELAFGRSPGRLYVCHTCDNPSCCNPAHLWLGDNLANQLDAVAKGRLVGRPQAGHLNHARKITEEQARAIIERIAAGETNTAIAKEFGVSHSNVSAIRRGLSWRHLPRPAGVGALYRKEPAGGRCKC